MMANRINIPPTPSTRNITIIMVSLSEAFTVVREIQIRNSACIMQIQEKISIVDSMKSPQSIMVNNSKEKKEKKFHEMKLRYIM